MSTLTPHHFVRGRIRPENCDLCGEIPAAEIHNIDIVADCICHQGSVCTPACNRHHHDGCGLAQSCSLAITTSCDDERMYDAFTALAQERREAASETVDAVVEAPPPPSVSYPAEPMLTILDANTLITRLESEIDEERDESAKAWYRTRKVVEALRELLTLVELFGEGNCVPAEEEQRLIVQAREALKPFDSQPEASGRRYGLLVG